MASKRIIFAVQGEGRGHLTQAISLQNILTGGGHEICAVLVGTSGARELPDFFYRQIKAPIISFESPNFITDDRKKSIRVWPSIFLTLRMMPVYLRNMRKVNRKLKELSPDMLINFYDPLVGMFYMLFNPRVPMVCVAHQYTFIHPDFQFPAKSFGWQKAALKVFSQLTASRSKKNLALSMYPMRDIKKQKLVVLPPLLRQAVYNATVSDGNYILIYILNPGYMEDVIAWHQKNPETVLHCFTDKKDIVGERKYDDTLSFHQINDQKFIEMMAGCHAFATTAGFESICEAMYFGKPVFMVPVESHFEQYSNARDGARAGAGIYDSEFRLDKLLAYLPRHNTDPALFRSWAGQTKERLLEEIASA